MYIAGHVLGVMHILVTMDPKKKMCGAFVTPVFLCPLLPSLRRGKATAKAAATAIEKGIERNLNLRFFRLFTVCSLGTDED